MKKLNFIRILISLVVFFFLFSEISFAQLTPPEQEYVLSFTSEKVAIAPVNTSLNLESEFTMEAWIFPKKNQNAVIMGKHLDAGHIEGISYIIRTVEEGKVEYIQTTGEAGSWTSITSTNIVDTNSWIHVAATLGSGTMKLYINGIEEGSIASPGTPLNESIPFAIGNSYDENLEPGAGFFGHIAQVRIWNNALTVTEIADNASIYLNGNETGLVAYWPLDDGVGQVASDLSPNELHLQLGTTPEEDENDPEWGNTCFTNDTYFSIGSTQDFPVGGVTIDLDTDGDLDCVWEHTLGEWSVMLKAAKNNGNGVFTISTEEIFGSDTIKMINPGPQILIYDFNGDGRDDFFYGDMGIDNEPHGGAPNKLFIQSTEGTMIDESEARLPDDSEYTHAETLGDFDGDGDMDIFVKESISGIWQGLAGFYVNDGNGYFERDLTRTPPELVHHEIFWSHTLTDVDKDGDLDLFAGTSARSEPGLEFFNERSVLLLNDGTGNFSYSQIDALPINIPHGYHTVNQPDIISKDINNDGWVDLLEEVTAINPETATIMGWNKLLYNNGNGTYRDASNRLPVSDRPFIDKLADLNNDGYPDIISGSLDKGFSIYLNRVGIDFIDATLLMPFDISHNDRALPGDFDNDGDIDLLVSNHERHILVKNEKPFDVLEHFPLTIPPIPELISPENELPVTINPVLKWIDSLETSCHIQVSTNPEFSNLILDTTGFVLDTLLLQNLSVNQSYYWRVNASNITGTSDWSEVRMFTATEVPVLQSPEAGEIVSITPTLSWNKISNAISYDVQLASDNTFSNLLVNETIADTTFSVTDSLEHIQTYYWRIRATTDVITGGWSETWHFKTKFVDPPEQDYLLHFGVEKIAIAPLDDSLNLGGEFTMEAWIFVNDSCDGIISGKVHGLMDSDPWKSYLLRFEDRGKSLVFIQTTGEPGSSRRIAVSYTNEFRTWTHVAATLGNDTMRVYIDGVETGWEVSPGIPYNTTAPFSVGNCATSDGNQTAEGIDGAMAQVRIWNKALTSEEIFNYANIFLNGNEEGLTAYWPLDDGEGQVARDLSPNELHLQLGTTPEEDEHDPLWICNVAPQQAETPSGETMLCQNNGDINYTTSGATYATSYEWSLTPEEAGTITGTDTVGTVDWSDTFTGTAEISVKGINDCGQSEFSEILTVYVNPLPIAGFTYETNELEVTFTNTSVNASSYLWDFGDSNTETVENPVYTYASAGEYSVVLTAYSDYCGEATDTQSVSISTGIGIIEFENLVRIYPNPSTGKLYLEIENLGNNDLFIKIIDVNGRVIYTSNKITKTIEEIDIGNYAKGVYFIQIISEKYVKTKKLIIE